VWSAADRFRVVVENDQILVEAIGAIEAVAC
jgi:hypothetical protein